WMTRLKASVVLRLMLLVKTTSRSAVEEPKTRGAAPVPMKLPEPQVRPAPPFRVTVRSPPLAAKPELEARLILVEAAVPERVRAMEPWVCQTAYWVPEAPARET